MTSPTPTPPQIEIVKFLLENGADPLLQYSGRAVPGYSGKKASEMARSTYHTEIAEL